MTCHENSAEITKKGSWEAHRNASKIRTFLVDVIMHVFVCHMQRQTIFKVDFLFNLLSIRMNGAIWPDMRYTFEPLHFNYELLSTNQANIVKKKSKSHKQCVIEKRLNNSFKLIYQSQNNAIKYHGKVLCQCEKAGMREIKITNAIEPTELTASLFIWLRRRLLSLSLLTTAPLASLSHSVLAVAVSSSFDDNGGVVVNSSLSACAGCDDLSSAHWTENGNADGMWLLLLLFLLLLILLLIKLFLKISPFSRSSIDSTAAVTVGAVASLVSLCWLCSRDVSLVSSNVLSLTFRVASLSPLIADSFNVSSKWIFPSSFSSTWCPSQMTAFPIFDFSFS